MHYLEGGDMPHSSVVDLEVDLPTEQVPRTDPRSEVVSIDPGRMGGTPCFVGTRVPVADLWDYLASGESVDRFVESFPSVSRQQAVRVIELAGNMLLDGLPAA